MADKMRWYRILDALRKKYRHPETGEPLPFTLDQAVECGKIPAGPGPGSTPKAMASGYISTFRKWGYVRRHERLEAVGRGRPAYSYIITDFGFEMKVSESPLEKVEGRLQKFMNAVMSMRDAQTEKEESSALKNLYCVYDDVLDEINKEEEDADEDVSSAGEKEG